MADQLLTLRKGLIDGGNKALINDLLDYLYEERIINYSEVERISEGNMVTSDKMRELVDTVRKKGDRASKIFIKRVLERDSTLSETLGIKAPMELPMPKQETKAEPSSQKTPSDLPLPTQEQKAEIPIQKESYGVTLCSDQEYKRISSEEADEMYRILPLKERSRLALIICNDKFNDPSFKERYGATFDVDGMEQLLNGLGYKVMKKINQTVQEMRETMKHFSADKEHKTSDSTFLVFMSHGQRDVICGTDSQMIRNENLKEEAKNVLHVDDIFNTYNNVNCPLLRDKPKVIIIQACRGNERSEVLVGDSPSNLTHIAQEHLEEDAMRMLQKERDFICFCSTTPDTVSWRDPKKGSLFIQRLIEHMKRDSHRYSIEDLFRNVQFSFKDKIQMPTQERKTLLKKFYLFPGH